MKIVLKATKIELTDSLKQFVEKKINSLEKFLKIFYNKKRSVRGKENVEAWVEVGRETTHHQKGSIYYAECQLRIPRKILRAVTKAENLESAINELKYELKREIDKERKGLLARVKRGGRILKRKLKTASALNFFRREREREEEI